MAGPVILFTRPQFARRERLPEGEAPPPPPEPSTPSTLGRDRRSVNATKTGAGAVPPRTVEQPPTGRPSKPGDALYALSREALRRRPVPTGAVVLPVADPSVIRELAALTADAGAEIDGIRAQLLAMEEQARGARALDAGEDAPKPQIGETAEAYRERYQAWEAAQEAAHLERRALDASDDADTHGDSDGDEDDDDAAAPEGDTTAPEGERKAKKHKKGRAR